MGAEGYLVSPAVFKTVEGGDPALVSSILTCPRQRGRAGARPFLIDILPPQTGQRVCPAGQTRCPGVCLK